MTDKTPAQLDAEIKEAIDLKLIDEWLAAGGNRKARSSIDYGTPLYWAFARDDQRKKIAKRIAKKAKPVNVTGINLSALAELVVRYGGNPKFPNAMNASLKPHIRRCVDAGYVSIDGRFLVLTPTGKAAVGDYLINKIEHKSKYTPRVNDLAREELRAGLLDKDVREHQSGIAKLEATLKALTA